MADATKQLEGSADAAVLADTAAADEATAAAARQAESGEPDAPNIANLDLHSTEALDALLGEVNKGEGEDTAPAGAKPDAPGAAPVVDKDKKPDGTPPADAAAAKPADPVPDIADIDKVALPPHTRPKTGEAFDAVKKIARDAVARREKEIEDLKKKIAEVESEAQKKLPAETVTELEDLRKFRKTIEVEKDPLFVEKFDARIQTNFSVILNKLLEAGVSEENVKQIEELGGPGEVDWDPILPKLPASVRRFIEAKLTDSESLVEEKKLAIAEAKKNIDKFIAERATREGKTVEAEAKVITETLNEYLPRMPWAVVKELPANATAEQKSAIEAHNKDAKLAQEKLQELVSDKSPEQRAALALGTVAGLRYKAQYDSIKSQLEQIEKSAAEKVTAAETKLAEVTKELEAIKKASQTSRARVGAAPGKQPLPNYVIRPASEAIDELRKQVEAGVE